MSGNAGLYAVTNRSIFSHIVFFPFLLFLFLARTFFLGRVANLLNSLSATLLSYPEVTRYTFDSLKFSMKLELFSYRSEQFLLILMLKALGILLKM